MDARRASSQIGAIAKRTNRIYQEWQPIWQKLAHAREGVGGFQDGTYLIAHPREFVDHSKTQIVTVTNDDGSTSQIKQTIPNPNPSVPSAKLLRRRALARYENFAGKIVDQMKSALFRIEPTRILAKDQHAEGPILDWWRNIDRKVLRSMTTFTPADDGSVAQQGSARTSASHFWSQAWDAAGTFGHMFVVMDRPSGPPAVTQADQQAPFQRMYTPLDAI